MNNLLKTWINRMAKLTGTALTENHLRILEYTHDYYETHQVGPLFPNLKKHLNVSKQDIETLFPHGLNSVYSWAGIPILSPDNLCKPAPDIHVEDFREVYLDHHATTNLREEIRALIFDCYRDAQGFGNPSSSTPYGEKAYDLIQTARMKIADCLDTQAKAIIFTGGGSEANNMAIKGIAFRHLEKKGHFITSKTEHSSVLESVRFLEKIGFEVTYLDVDKEGFVTPRSVRDCMKDNTLLVAVMAANNEIGTINPIDEIGEICTRAGVPLMVDAVQAFGRMNIHPENSGISLLSISGHKIYGPKGVGALYVDEKLSLVPLIHGGEQEGGLRAGTENVVSIAALGKAAQMIHREMARENRRLTELRDDFFDELSHMVPGCRLNGPMQSRLPNNLSIGFPNADSGSLLLGLNQIGVYASAGSACHSGNAEDSHVLKAIGADIENFGTIRFSFGLSTTKEDLQYVLKHLPAVLRKIQSS